MQLPIPMVGGGTDALIRRRLGEEERVQNILALGGVPGRREPERGLPGGRRAVLGALVGAQVAAEPGVLLEDLGEAPSQLGRDGCRVFRFRGEEVHRADA